MISLLDRDEVMSHPDFRLKLEAMGFGFFIPVFFVTSGVRFDLGALTAEVSSLAMVPVFLAALLVVRGLPALVYRDGWTPAGPPLRPSCRPRRSLSSWQPKRSAWASA